MTTAPAPGDVIDSDFTGPLGVALAGWTDYSSSFTITASSTSPTLGNSSKTARYRQVGKTVTYSFSVTIGSTFSPGSGTYFFPFPVPVNTGTIATMIGPALILDQGVQYRPAVLQTFTSTQLVIIYGTGGAFLDGTGSGTAWAAGDIIKGEITYEAA